MAQDDNDAARPAHLEPSELGTKEYWDNYYQNDLDDDNDSDDDDNGDGDEDEASQIEEKPKADPSELESWFDDVDAPAKVLEYLTSDDFPLSPAATTGHGSNISILDLGTGNGSMLFSLRVHGGFTGSMVGIDYSQQSVDLATKLGQRYGSDFTFAKFDLIRDNLGTASWWPPREGNIGFDLVLDKGTFDAISLSSETLADPESGQTKRIHELYAHKIVGLIAPGGYFVITSCNWTEDEVVRWFSHGDDLEGALEVFSKIQYPEYEFGGQKGQGVASVCFRKRQQ